MKRYLVTGGAGFIGAAIVKRLVDENNFVRVFDNESRGSKNKLKGLGRHLEFVKGDIRDYARVKKASERIDTIIHLASINGTRFFYEKPDVVLSVGISGMLNVLEAAREKSVANLFFASSSEVYQTPPTIPTPEDIPLVIPTPFNPRYSYAGAKIASELMTLYIGRKFLKKAIIFRPHNVYGPDMGTEHVIPELLLQAISKKRKIFKLRIQGSGKETRSFIYIDDFVDALMLLDKKGKNGQIYNIGTTEEISIRELVHEIGKVTKAKIDIKTSPIKRGSTPRRCPDISKISKLGFRQKVTLEKGLLKTYLWYNGQRQLNGKKTQ